MNDIRKACVEAIFREDIEARRSLGHIVGFIDIDVVDLVDIVIDTINKEL